ncbi:oleosin 18.2 kDa [Tanacetum coccineum]
MINRLMKKTVKSPSEEIVNSPPEGIVNSPPEGIVNSPPEGILYSPPEGIVNSPPEGIVTNIHKKAKIRQKLNKIKHEIGKSVENRSQRHPSSQNVASSSSAQQVPQACVAGSAIAGASGSTSSSVKKDLNEDVVDKVSVIGFPKAMVRETVKKLTQTRQTVDLMWC